MPNFVKIAEVAAIEAEPFLARLAPEITSFARGLRPSLAKGTLEAVLPALHIGEAALPSKAVTLGEAQLSKIASFFPEAIPETLASVAKAPANKNIDSLLHLPAVRDLAIHLSDSSLAWESGSQALGARATMHSDILVAKWGLAADVQRVGLERTRTIAQLLKERPQELLAYNGFLERQGALAAFDSQLERLATSRARRFQLDLAPKFLDLDLPAAKISSINAQLGAQASWGDGFVNMGRDAFLKPWEAKTGGLGVHEFTHHEQGYLIACRVSDMLGINTPTAGTAKLSGLLQGLKKTGALSQPTVERFLLQRNGRQLTAAASERADKLLDSFKTFTNLPVGQLEIEKQFAAIDHYSTILHNPSNINVSRSFLETLHNPLKGPALAKAIFGAPEAEAERRLLLTEFPQGNLTSWTPEKDVTARRILGKSFDRAESIVNRLYSGCNDVYFNSLHEREARFNQFVAEKVLKLHGAR